MVGVGVLVDPLVHKVGAPQTCIQRQPVLQGEDSQHRGGAEVVPQLAAYQPGLHVAAVLFLVLHAQGGHVVR